MSDIMQSALYVVNHFVLVITHFTDKKTEVKWISSSPTACK